MSITYYYDLKYFHALARTLRERSETPLRRVAQALAVDRAIDPRITTRHQTTLRH